jgi:hypothetical protein
MSTRTRSWAAVSVAAAMSVASIFSAPSASAQQQALGLTLLRTFIRTQNNQFLLQPSSFTQAFLPTTATCPTTATRGCTLRIEVSGTFDATVYPGSVTAEVTITGGSGLPGVDPDGQVEVMGTPSNGYEARSFQWMQRSIPAGIRVTVSVLFEGGGVYALDRTETIQLLRN